MRAGTAGGISVLGVLVSSFTIALVVMAVWPGSFALFAPILCSAERPDAFVVVDRYQVRPGETAFNFTMYCVGADGRFDEIGFLAPMAWLFVSIVVILTVVAVIGVWRLGRRARAGHPAGHPAGPESPFG